MYDDIPFDAERHVLWLQDVGLNALYVRDCDALAGIADIGSVESLCNCTVV